jgi:predicted transcriptional regulator
MNTQVKNFTTTLPTNTLSWLDEVAQESKQPKNRILEDALRMYQAEYIRKRIAESYRTSSNDAEMMELANAGLSDWDTNIAQWEK